MSHGKSRLIREQLLRNAQENGVGCTFADEELSGFLLGWTSVVELRAQGGRFEKERSGSLEELTHALERVLNALGEDGFLAVFMHKTTWVRAIVHRSNAVAFYLWARGQDDQNLVFLYSLARHGYLTIEMEIDAAEPPQGSLLVDAFGVWGQTLKMAAMRE